MIRFLILIYFLISNYGCFYAQTNMCEEIGRTAILHTEYRDTVTQIGGRSYLHLILSYSNPGCDTVKLWLNKWVVYISTWNTCQQYEEGRTFAIYDANYIIFARTSALNTIIKDWYYEYYHGYVPVYREKSNNIKVMSPYSSFRVNLFIPDTTLITCFAQNPMNIKHEYLSVDKHPDNQFSPQSFITGDSLDIIFMEQPNYSYSIELNADSTHKCAISQEKNLYGTFKTSFKE